MSQTPPLLLIHPAGARRQAVAAFVLQQGFTSVTCLTVEGAGEELVSALSTPIARWVVVHHSQLNVLCEPVQDMLRRADAILIAEDGATSANGFRRYLTEPIDFDEFEKMLPPARLRSSPPYVELGRIDDQGSTVLLRGLAHAMNNVATSSLGWLSLAERQDDPLKRGHHLNDLRGDLSRLSRLSRALTYLSGSKGPPSLTAVDIHALVLGLGHVPTPRPMATRWVLAEREPLELALALAVSGTQAKLDIRGDSSTELIITLTDTSLNPKHVETPALDRLLETQRFGRALGLALLALVVARCEGTFRVIPLAPEGAMLSLAIPRALEAMEAHP